MSAARRVTAFGLAAVAGLIILAPSASAASTDVITPAVSALGTANLYVGDPSAVLDQAAVNGALNSQLKIAVLPADAGNATTLASEIGNGLGASSSDKLTIGVVVGNSFSAASSTYCPGWAGAQAKAAVADNATQLKAGGAHPDLTKLLVDFARKVQTGPLAGTSSCAQAGGTGAAGSSSKGTSGTTVAIVLVVLAGLAAGAIGFVVVRSRRKQRTVLADARANVLNYYDRLANEVNTIDTKDFVKARQAMNDASERFTAAGSQLAVADSVGDYALARRTSLEGLYAARTARAELGMDPGPDLPPVDEARGEQLTDARDVTVAGQTFQGHPGYTPGAPYFFGGGQGVPGGWYATPFWETLLLTSVLSGGFGGGFGGGGYNNGYDSGYNAGYQAGDGGGGGYGGGGDFGGGFGGGGDFGGGGGGDFGGGGGGSW